MQAIVFIILQIFFATRALLENWEISSDIDYSPILAEEYSTT